MNLHEYQAKQLFQKYQLPISPGEVVADVKEAKAIFKRLGGQRCVVKAQVHAGGRGKAGGVKLVSNEEELAKAIEGMIGKRLVTYQTTAEGQPIHKVLLTATCDIARELYLGAVIDRSSQRMVIMASTEGGVEIEAVAKKSPEKILKVVVDPIVGVLPYQGRDMAFALKLTSEQQKKFVQLMMNLGRMFVECDVSLLEVNPLVVTPEDDLICLDGKVVIDDNAIYRQKEIQSMRDPSQEDERENHAREWELSYIALEGNIGCLVNGAGLAMATMDLIKLHGGEPANFLDVGGGATQERVTEAFKIILSDKNVKGILVNIFGGIVRCDLIAEGIIAAVSGVGIKVPVVVRLEGNNADVGAEKLKKSGLNIIPANGFDAAAKQIVAAVGGKK